MNLNYWKFTYNLVVDNFTRWVEPTTARETARALLNHAGRYGHATEWLSDRGTQSL